MKSRKLSKNDGNMKAGDEVKWIGCKTKRPEFGIVADVLGGDTYRVNWNEDVYRTEHVYGEELENLSRTDSDD